MNYHKLSTNFHELHFACLLLRCVIPTVILVKTRKASPMPIGMTARERPKRKTILVLLDTAASFTAKRHSRRHPRENEDGHPQCLLERPHGNTRNEKQSLFKWTLPLPPPRSVMPAKAGIPYAYWNVRMGTPETKNNPCFNGSRSRRQCLITMLLSIMLPS